MIKEQGTQKKRWGSFTKNLILLTFVCFNIRPSFAFLFTPNSLEPTTRSAAPTAITATSHRYDCRLNAADDNEPTDSTSTATTPQPGAVKGVTLKVAFDTNWGVAETANDAPSVRFTCDASLDMVHRLRYCSDAVLVGRGTVEQDDCSLTVRRLGVVPADLDSIQQPLRVILDPRLSLILAEINEGEEYKVLTDGYPTVVYHCVSDVDEESLGLLESVTLVRLEDTAGAPDSSEREVNPPPEGMRPGRYIPMKAMVDHLKENFGVDHLMVEGGPKTALNFLQAGLIDRAIIVRAPIAFEEPYPSAMTDETLKEAGLEIVAKSLASGVDTIDYWARPGESWPTDPVDEWP